MSNQPIARLRYWERATGTEYDIAACFRPQNEKLRSWKTDVAPSDGQTRNPKFPQMLASEAFLRAERGEGKVSIAKSKQRNDQQRQPPSGNGGGFEGGGDFGDDDIPFSRFDERRA